MGEGGGQQEGVRQTDGRGEIETVSEALRQQQQQGDDMGTGAGLHGLPASLP